MIVCDQLPLQQYGSWCTPINCVYLVKIFETCQVIQMIITKVFVSQLTMLSQQQEDCLFHGKNQFHILHTTRDLSGDAMVLET